MIKRFSKFVLLPIVAVLGPLFLTIAGCATSSNSGGTTPPTNSTGPNPIVVSAIQNGTSLAVSFGLPLAASATSATAVQADATLALTSVNGLLAVLNPSSVTASSTAALQTLVTQIVNGQVSSLSGSPIVEGIVELALPLLVKNLSGGLTAASGVVAANIPASDLAYMVAFFTGAQQGLQNYLGIGTATKTVAAPPASAIVAGNATLDMDNFKAQLQTKLAAIKAKVSVPVPNAVKQ